MNAMHIAREEEGGGGERGGWGGERVYGPIRKIPDGGGGLE